MSVDKIAPPSAALALNRTSERVAALVSNEAESHPNAAPPRAPALAASQIEGIAKQLDSYIRSVSRSLEFKVDDASGRTIISVRDAETGDLIRQIPNEEALRFAQMAEEQTIVLLKETV